MMMPHPLIPVSLPPASVTMAMSQMNHLSTIANMAAAAQGQSLPSRMVTSVIKVNFKTEISNFLPPGSVYTWIFIFGWGVVLLWMLGFQERVPDSPSPAPSLEDNRRPGSHPSSHRSSSVSSSPAHTESSSDRIRTFTLKKPKCAVQTVVVLSHLQRVKMHLLGNITPVFVILSPAMHHNGMSMNHTLLGLSPNMPPGPKEGDLAHDMSHESKRMHADKGQSGLINKKRMVELCSLNPTVNSILSTKICSVAAAK